MGWKLYLDDKRPLPEGYVLALSFDEAVRLVTEKGCPDFISFDHDLGINPDGSEQNGYDFAKWFVDQDLDGKINIPTNFDYKVHSSNPAGVRNIDGIMKGYLKFKRGT